MSKRIIVCPRCPGCGHEGDPLSDPREMFCPNVCCDVHSWNGYQTERWNLDHVKRHQGPNNLKVMGT